MVTMDGELPGISQPVGTVETAAIKNKRFLRADPPERKTLILQGLSVISPGAVVLHEVYLLRLLRPRNTSDYIV